MSKPNETGNTAKPATDLDVKALIAAAITEYSQGEAARTEAAVNAALAAHTLPAAAINDAGTLEIESGLTKAEAASLVKRVVILPPKVKGDEPQVITKDVEPGEVLAFKDLGDKVCVVTIDGQKFYGDKLAA